MPEHDRTNSVGYIVGFAVAICLGCAVVVAASAVGLKPLQDKNARVDRLTKVLEVAGLVSSDEELNAEQIIARFEQNIDARIIDMKTGEYNSTVDPSTFDQRSAAKDPKRSFKAPPNSAKVFRLPHHALVYQVKKSDTVDQVILPIQGYGLWSTLYGYLAMKADGQTITGITFYEHGETPGLGGEVENPRWQAKWKGRKAYSDDGKVAIKVIKGAAGSPQNDPHSVDGLSGATITSRGVSHTLEFWLGKNGFGPYLDRFRTVTAAVHGDKIR